ncbi:dnaA protein [Aliiroseovarius crassostreae]|uniref:Chromosomal replication initiator DnaA n=1 Tax=Aliiroseovarius crassostreae TaxID=154981 RepID=A0A0P7JSS2_9RHOB|nr:DnaA/Hda family protein [Aliiroseovarius crassostreae]KPN64453.1 chromosomal replication initiator DnaA [Aliiroseovarius crassostreae]UWP89744.1 chromosomal replication initiator DnaA [Aliiroseovarius crassostreae]UWP96027.1 chromosomal replication initiator DnaA [Aliiroseovarius crassostreae]SFU35288.1 dnaA protein [Aliiroseovarius crassostreae]
MQDQLAFDLPVTPARGVDDFLVTPSNQAAMAIVNGWALWPNQKLVLAGAGGTGKTHLAHVWADQSGAEIIHADRLDTTVIEALAGGSVVVEDVDRIAGDRASETALFHLHNLVLAEGGWLMLTAEDAPSRWGLRLPDLRSRMEGTTLARLEPPDDMLLSAVLVKLFHDRQISVNANLVDYLVPRMERSLAAAGHLVQALDQVALSEQRPITRALAQRVLGIAASGDFGGDFGGD